MIDKEVDEQQRRETMARRHAGLIEFEELRTQAYAKETERRRTQRDESHKAVKDRNTLREERRQESLTNLQHDISARFDAAARRTASQSQEAQEQWHEKFSRHKQTTEQWRQSTSEQELARSRHLQERWEAKQRMLTSRGGEEARIKEERDRDRMKQQEASRAAAEQIKLDAMNARLAKARERALREGASNAENAIKAREAAREMAEKNALAAQRRKMQAEDQATHLEELQEALQAKERRIESQVEQLMARRRDAANDNARKQQEHDAKLLSLRRQQNQKDAARKQHLSAKSQAEAKRVAAMRKKQDSTIEDHRRANELIALQRKANQQRLQKLTRSFSSASASLMSVSQQSL